MDEDELLRDQEEYNKLLAFQERIKDKIADAIREGNETVTIGNTIKMNVKLLENDEEDGESSIERYRLESENKSVTAKATKDKNGKIEVDIDFDIKTIKTIMEVKRQKEHDDELKIKHHEVEKDNSELLRKELEEKLKTGKAKELEAGREFSHSENAIMFIKRAFGVSATNLYRVQGRDNHDFKYVCKTASGKYQQLDLSSRNEGRNPNQKVWLMKDGKLVEEKVESLLVNGKYAIATDFPESVASQNTTTYFVVRLPSGKYIGTEVGEKYGVNRDPSGDYMQKDYSAAGKSKYQLEKIVQAAETAKNIDEINEDQKLTTMETELVRKLQRDKGLSDKQVEGAFETIGLLKDIGFQHDEIKEFMENVIEGEDYDDIAEEIKEQKEDGKSKEEIQENYENEKDSDDEKLPGGGYMRRGYDPRHDI